jgi:hypothetical protein
MPALLRSAISGAKSRRRALEHGVGRAAGEGCQIGPRKMRHRIGFSGAPRLATGETATRARRRVRADPGLRIRIQCEKW